MHSLEDALEIYNTSGREASNLADFPLDDREPEVARGVGDFLNLTPKGYSASEFQKLQDEYKPLLKFEAFQD